MQACVEGCPFRYAPNATGAIAKEVNCEPLAGSKQITSRALSHAVRVPSTTVTVGDEKMVEGERRATEGANEDERH